MHLLDLILREVGSTF